MQLDVRRDWFLYGLSWLIWRLPGRGAAKMAEFSHVEAGSGVDMLEAAEETGRREMRRKYYIHALDELKHSRLFRERARALSAQRTRAQKVLDDVGYIPNQGIRGSQSLFSELGEERFLAFVYVAELRGAQQFDVNASLMRDDPETQAMFQEIARDERFHIAYSRRELEQMKAAGRGKEARSHVWAIRRQRFGQAWLRFSRRLGEAVAGLWLWLLYWAVLGPFSLLARVVESPSSGFTAPDADERSLADRAAEPG